MIVGYILVKDDKIYCGQDYDYPDEPDLWLTPEELRRSGNEISIFGWDSAHSKLQRMYGAEIRQLYAQQI